jgi:hypothetical protein
MSSIRTYEKNAVHALHSAVTVIGCPENYPRLSPTNYSYRDIACIFANLILVLRNTFQKGQNGNLVLIGICDNIQYIC